MIAVHEDGAKHLALLCKCGDPDHLRGMPSLMRWNEEEGLPVEKVGGNKLLWWNADVEVDKGVSVELAKKYSHLATTDKYLEAVKAVDLEDQLIKQVQMIMKQSTTALGIRMVAALESIGATIPENIAALFIAAISLDEMESEAGMEFVLKLVAEGSQNEEAASKTTLH